MQHQIHSLMEENLEQFNKGSLQGKGSCTRAKYKSLGASIPSVLISSIHVSQCVYDHNLGIISILYF